MRGEALCFLPNDLTMTNDLGSVRKRYEKHALTQDMLPKEPGILLMEWLEAARAVNPDEFNAMCLSTVGADGSPDARMVLAKDVQENAVSFYTNYGSNKALQILGHPAVALTFYWPELERQVRIQGRAKQLPAAVSDAYFTSRPQESQIGAWCSDQSRPLEKGADLESRVKEVTERFADVAVIPRPPHWGGFGVEMQVVEFWQGRPSRLHHRWRFDRNHSGWEVQALQP